MPLQLPFAYVVTYDLKQEIGRYHPFFEELKQSHKWWHYIDNTWIILRYETLVELAPKLRTLIFKSDHLLIIPAKGPADGWLPPDGWKWIRENVPNEW